MAKLNRAAEAAPIIPSAKVHQEKDIAKVLAFFRYKVGTSLDCALHINRLRNSVTWYIKALEEMGLLQAIFKAKDQHTGYTAKHYSANPAMWKQKPIRRELDLFGEGGAI